MENNTITAPRGFLVASAACGIKKADRLDLALLVCPTGAKAAACFTTNKITSAAVQVSKHHIRSPRIWAVVVNSGNANSCTGKMGLANAIKMCTAMASYLDVDPHRVLVASTGIIGKQLPINRITAGIKRAAKKLSATAPAGLSFARAIMTTDSKPKQAIRRLTIRPSDRPITIAAAIKGAGMIAPYMATTLCFITTDVDISKPLLAEALNSAIGNSLNKLTVDGHQSTNDTAIILASGLAGNQPIASKDRQYKKFTDTLMELCDELVTQLALNAEGATRMFKVIVQGAATKTQATKAARAIANYPLVKCAVHGADPNWGRIICAVGSSGVKLNPDKLSCKFSPLPISQGTGPDQREITVFKNGEPTKFDRKKAKKIISQTQHTIIVNLGAGNASDFCYGCDLSAEYVTINAKCVDVFMRK